MSHPYLDIWLRGTTCDKPHIKREVLLESETHIVLKHGAHAEHINRFTGSLNCWSFARLYLKSDFEATAKEFDYHINLRAKYLKEWTGRINLKRVRADCEELGAVFP